jgi:hypothetical protein
MAGWVLVEVLVLTPEIKNWEETSIGGVRLLIYRRRKETKLSG